MSILPHDLRLSTISSAREALDHRDKHKHDVELQEGAAHILYQKLAFALQLQPNNPYNYNTTSNKHDGSIIAGKRQHVYYSGMDATTMQRLRGIDARDSFNDVDHEISMICSCLEMVHRASSEMISETWNSIGSELALPLLLQVLERPFTQLSLMPSGIDKKLNHNVKLSVQKATKLLAIYSLVPQAKVPITCHPSLLPILVKIVDTHGLNRMRSSTSSSRRQLNDAGMGANGIRSIEAGAGLYMTEAARFNTIATLTNLAAAERVRMRMLGEPGLVDHIALVAHTERSDVARQCSALALMNLSNGDKEHVPELEGNELLLETLVKLSSDEVPETRRNASVAFFNLACADENTVLLACYKDGLILQVLLDLTAGKHNRMQHDGGSQIHQEEARTSAAETLFNMSCSEIIETTDKMVNHYGLLESLASTLVSRNDFDYSENADLPPTNLDVKLYCAATLRRMAEITHYTPNSDPNGSHAALLSALVTASSWTRSACIAEAFATQAKVARNRAEMIRHHGLLKAVSRLALMTTGSTEVDKLRNAAVGAIVYLTREPSTRPIMARNEGIMMALTRNSYLVETEKQSSRRLQQHSSDLENEAKIPDEDPPYYSSQHEPTKKQLEQQRFIQMAMKDLVSAM